MREKGSYLFTSESVSDGHPDKVADRLSDTVLDAYLAADPEARVACETMVTTNRIILAGEVRGPSHVIESLEPLVREAVRDIGYDQQGFSWRDATSFECHLHAQSPDIAIGVDASGNKDEGAGDQGIMFGYATNETQSLMPAPIHYAHRILQDLRALRLDGSVKLQPDAKSQVTLAYQDGKPVRATSVVVSTQHDESARQSDIRDAVRRVVRSALPDGWMCADDQLYVNPTGVFVVGGPDGDCGLTGRKIIVDTYGGAPPPRRGAVNRHGTTNGDPTAPDACRYLAKNVVASGLADRCTLQISYAIGIAHPLSVYVDLHGTGHDVDEDRLERMLRDILDLTPRGIRQHLRLNRPIYARSAAYGHFGRAPDDERDDFTWERTNLVEPLRAAFGR